MKEHLIPYRKYFILITYAIVLYLGLSNIGKITSAIGNTFGILSPLIIGLVIAFILNIFVNLFERKLFGRLWPKHPKLARYKRAISVTLTFVLLILLITLLTVFIVPQIASSFSSLVRAVPVGMERLTNWIDGMMETYSIQINIWDKIMENWKEILNSVSGFMSTALPQLYGMTLNVGNGLYNLFFGFILAVYLLFAKEKLITISKKVMYAFFSTETSGNTIEFFSFANRVFNRFIGGQLTEALILGVLCFIGLLILQIPYALLVSVVVAVTSLIPIIGAWIGVIFSVLVLLMVDPWKALWFVIFFLILQQVESNLIYPRVVGNAVGVSGVWVLGAIVVGGSLFGLLGMVLSVPVCSILYFTMRTIVNRRLAKKSIIITPED